MVAPEIDGDASKVTVELPKSSVSDIAGDSLDLTVSTPIAGMTIPSEGLSELAKQSGQHRVVHRGIGHCDRRRAAASRTPSGWMWR